MLRRSVNWLRSAQTAQGGWAPLAPDETATSQSPTPLHTAHALLALLAAGVDIKDAQIASAIRYLKSTMATSSGEPWASTSEVETVDQDAALDFRHFTTPWVLCALLDGGVSIGDPVVANAIQWLINEQHSLGYWSSPLTPGQTPIWATFDAIFALSRVRRTAIEKFSELIYSDARAVELDYAWASYFSALDNFEQQATVLRFRRSRWLYVWNSMLTFAVALLLLFRGTNIGLNLSPATKIIGSALIGLVPGFAPFLYQVLLEEFRSRRRNAKDG